MRVLNNDYPWDGSFLGSYDGIIYQKTRLENSDYYMLLFSEGVLYCVGVASKDLFPIIVDEIKPLFGIAKRGSHRIRIDKKDFLIYRVQVKETVSGTDIVWETPLNKLDSKHVLRSDEKFVREVQKILIFSDILSLTSMGETNIRIRDGFVPVPVNDKSTSLLKEQTRDHFDSVFSKWFGEKTLPINIIKIMLKLDHIDEDMICGELAKIRKKTEEIILRYNKEYVWYSCHIVDKLSKYLLM